MTKVIQTWRWPIRTLGIIGLGAIYLLVQWGCATQPPGLPEEVRAELGTIGIVSAQWTPEPEFEGPGTGFMEHTGGAWEGLTSGAQKGAAKGFELGLKYHPGAPPPSLIGLAAWPLFHLVGLAVGATLGTTVGTIVGGVSGMTQGIIHPQDNNSLDEQKIVRETLDSYLQKLGMQERIRKEVLAVARQNTSHPITELDQGGPTQRKIPVSYQSLKEKNLDTILEVSVVSLGLESTSAFAPDFSVFMVIKADLRRVEDDAILYRTTLNYTSHSLPYEEWAEKNAYAFQRALNEGYRNLAEQVVSTLL